MAEAMAWNSIPEMNMLAVNIVFRFVLVPAVIIRFLPVSIAGGIMIVSNGMSFFTVMVMSYFAVLVMPFFTVMIVPPVVMVPISGVSIGLVMIPL